MSSATDIGMVKTMGMVMGALALFALIIGIIARLLGGGTAHSDDPVMSQVLLDRIAPVAAVRTSIEELPSEDSEAAAPMEVAAAPKSAEELYNGVCSACHDTGVAGAPMKGDEAAWSERVAKGIDALVMSSINGIGTMPARGGSTYSDEEMRRAVQYVAGLEVDEAASAPPAATDQSADSGESSEEVMDGAADSAEETDSTASAEMATNEENTDAPESQTPGATDEQPPAEEPADDDAATEESASTSVTDSEPEPADSVAEQSPAAESAIAVELVGEEPEGLSDHVRSTVDSLCVACHLAGVGGAPKMGDQAAWQERADKGMDALVASVINGVGAMPPRGGTTLSDEEIPVAIQYIMSK